MEGEGIMGLYDTLFFLCPYCQESTSSQSKLGECLLRSVKIGDLFAYRFIDVRLLLKNPCESCGKKIVAVFDKGKFVSVERKGLENLREKPFGDEEAIEILKKRIKGLEK